MAHLNRAPAGRWPTLCGALLNEDARPIRQGSPARPAFACDGQIEALTTAFLERVRRKTPCRGLRGMARASGPNATPLSEKATLRVQVRTSPRTTA